MTCVHSFLERWMECDGKVNIKMYPLQVTFGPTISRQYIQGEVAQTVDANSALYFNVSFKVKLQSYLQSFHV